MKYILIYLLFANAIAFLLMGMDKRRAELGKWRIRERTLFLSAILGGSIGALLGMYLFRHKTKHRSFVLGMPLILLIQLAAVFFLIR